MVRSVRPPLFSQTKDHRETIGIRETGRPSRGGFFFVYGALSGYRERFGHGLNARRHTEKTILLWTLAPSPESP